MDKIKAQAIVDTLSKYYDDTPQLKFNTCYELLVAVILSAQCTDERVNKVTAELFKNYSTPDKMVTLSQAELGKMIYSCGLYKNKAKHVIEMSKMLISDFGSKVPDNREDLEKLPGVGRKTANVVLNVIFNKPTMPVDTHLLRISPKIGLAEGKTPLEVEKSLLKRIPPQYLEHAHHWLILHGRYICTARNPKCEECPINHICAKNSPLA